jgi:NADH-quinone oxidoreductase subunit N
MVQQWNEQLNNITGSLPYFLPELILVSFFLLFLILALFQISHKVLLTLGIICFGTSCALAFTQGLNVHLVLFNGLIRLDGFSIYLKMLISLSGFLCCLLSFHKPKQHLPEYLALITAIVLGGHLMIMTTHFLMVFISLELISISSYVLAGYSFTKSGSEGSLKYFLFGAVSSAIMLYGFSILYGITGTLDFSLPQFTEQLIIRNSSFALLAAVMALAGFLFKMAAVPMHLWAPDIYEAAPIPIVAFLSVAPKLAGLGILFKFVLAVNLYGNSHYDWPVILAGIAMLTITVGNFSALRQQNPKRLMAYSSIAQSGFLLIGVAAFLPQAVHFMLFYASIYLLMNFLVFLYLDFFEEKGITTIPQFAGVGKNFPLPMILLLVGLIALTGLPPTAGFTAKLFIFTGLWQAYELSGKSILLWLLVFGLINTVISLFYYLRIPYFAFLKAGLPAEKPTTSSFQNFLAFVLVLVILLLFFMPGLLMGWINRINFVL